MQGVCEINYLRNILNSIFKDYEFLPVTMPFSRCLSFSIEGFEKITMVCDDNNLNQSIELMRAQLEKLYELYNEKYIFSEPQLIIIVAAPPVIKMKIGMLHRKRYEEIKRNEVKFEDKRLSRNK